MYCTGDTWWPQEAFGKRVLAQKGSELGGGGCPPSGAGPGAPASPGPSLCFLPQVTGIPMNCSVKLQLSLYIKAIRGIG